MPFESNPEDWNIPGTKICQLPRQKENYYQKGDETLKMTHVVWIS